MEGKVNQHKSELALLSGKTLQKYFVRNGTEQKASAKLKSILEILANHCQTSPFGWQEYVKYSCLGV